MYWKRWVRFGLLGSSGLEQYAILLVPEMRCSLPVARVSVIC